MFHSHSPCRSPCANSAARFGADDGSPWGILHTPLPLALLTQELRGESTSVGCVWVCVWVWVCECVGVGGWGSERWGGISDGNSWIRTNFGFVDYAWYWETKISTAGKGEYLDSTNRAGAITGALPKKGGLVSVRHCAYDIVQDRSTYKCTCLDVKDPLHLPLTRSPIYTGKCFIPIPHVTVPVSVLQQGGDST